MMTPRVLSPAATRSPASRKPPKQESSASKSRYQHPPDIGAILSGAGNKRSPASRASKGMHSYELDSTLRKYGTKSYDPYKDRQNRRMMREGTFDLDDASDHSPRQSINKHSNPRTKSAAKTKETLDRLLQDQDNIHSASDFLDHLPPSRRSSRNSVATGITRSRAGVTSSSNLPKSSNVARGIQYFNMYICIINY